MIEDLPPDMKKRVDALLALDHDIMAKAIHCAFLAGMQLSIRLVRNRADDCERMGKPDKRQEALVIEGIIRICQVEIGSGRTPRPQLTKEELEEMDRIS
jgi:hypothetical protein